MNDIMRILKENNCKVIKQDYNELNSIEFSVRKQSSDKLEQMLTALFDVKYKYLRTE